MNNTQKRSRTKPGARLSHYIILALFSLALYANTIPHEYALDDAIVVYQNEFTQQGFQGLDDIFTYDSFVGFWRTSYSHMTPEEIQENKRLVAGGRYRPLSFALLAIEYELFEQNPHVSHFVNILLYFLCALLLYRFLEPLFPGSGHWVRHLPFVAALIFLAHPIHTEAVANIKGRDEILSLIGALGAGVFYLKSLVRFRYKYFAYAFLFMFLGLLSKETTITWLAVIPVAAFFLTDAKTKALTKAWIPLILASGLFLGIRAMVLGDPGGEGEIARELMNNPFLDASVSEKWGSILLILGVYLKLLFVPHPLTYDYYPYHIPFKQADKLMPEMTDFMPLLVLVVYIILFAFLAFAIVKRYKNTAGKLLSVSGFAVIAFLAPLSVVANIFFPVGTFMNERFLFFPSVGFCALLAYLITRLLLKYMQHEQRSRQWGVAVLVIILGLYSVKTISRNRAWKNDYTLFTTDVQTSYNSAKSTCSAGGKLLEKANTLKMPQEKQVLVDSAVHYLNQSLTIHPDYVDAMLLLGNAWYEKSNPAKSIHWYTEILRLRPSHNLAIKNARIVLQKSINLFHNKKSKVSPETFIKACKALDSVRPEIPETPHIIGVMYARYLGNIPKGIPYMKESLERKRKNIDVWKDLGVAYGKMKKYEEALNCFEEAWKLNEKDPQVAFNLSVTHRQLGNMQEAQNYYSIHQRLKNTSGN